MDGEDDSDLAQGTTLGRYTIGRRLGRGGMGAVYEATHLDLHKRVAIKVLLSDGARDPGIRARFLREGQAASKLRHPNVVEILDVGAQDGKPYLVMEFLEGEDLCHVVDREGAIPLVHLADLMMPVLDAVAAAHDEGIVHRDLKPENIFLARTRLADQEPKLLDFGISKANDMGTGPALTATNTMMGTTVYMSPEQAQNSKDVDGRADQYSLGVILYECATGVHPFNDASRQDSLFALLSAIVSGTFAPPRTLRPELPVGFEHLVLRAMATNRDARFPSVREMAEALLPFTSPLALQTWEKRFSNRSQTGQTRLSGQSLPPADVSARTSTVAAGEADLNGATSIVHRRASTLGSSVKTFDIPATPRKRSRAIPWVVGGVLGVTALGGIALLASSLGEPAPTPHPTAVAPPSPAVVATPHPTPVATAHPAAVATPHPAVPPLPSIVPPAVVAPAPQPVAVVAPVVVAHPVEVVAAAPDAHHQHHHAHSHSAGTSSTTPSEHVY